MSATPIPAGYHTVTPYLAIKNAVKALEFYKTAFGATETSKLMVPDGRLGHAEIRLGDSVIMLSDEFPEYGGKSPETLGGSPVSIHLYVEDVDAFFKRALAAGAKERKPVMDQFYGDRSGQLEDPFGHLWWVATHKEDVAPEECRSACRRCSRGRSRAGQEENPRFAAGRSGFVGMTEDAIERARETVEGVYRAESRRILATLIRLLGDFDLAEDALHDAFRAALEKWPQEGVPANPRSWLISAGRFKALDAMRRRVRFRRLAGSHCRATLHRCR